MTEHVLLTFSEAVSAAVKGHECITRIFWTTDEWLRLVDRSPGGIEYVMLFDAMALGVGPASVASTLHLLMNGRGDVLPGPLVRVRIGGRQALCLTASDYTAEIDDMVAKDWRIVPREEITEFVVKHEEARKQAAADR